MVTLPPSPDSGATAFQTQGGHRFVVAWTDGGQWFGWVPRARLSPAPFNVGHGSSGGGVGFVPVGTEWRGYRCAHDVPILADVTDTLLEVGRAPASTVFSTRPTTNPAVLELQLRHQRYVGGTPPEYRTTTDVEPLGDTRLVIERRWLRDCERGVVGEPDPYE